MWVNPKLRVSLLISSNDKAMECWSEKVLIPYPKQNNKKKGFSYGSL